jgi:very-short-patch-repair endonuclease
MLVRMARATRDIQQTRRSGARRVKKPVAGADDRSYPVKLLGVRPLFLASGTRDQKVAAIAERQRGRVARRQLLAAGISRNAIDRMLASGRLHPIHAGVYAAGHLAPIELGRETAALLAVPDGAFLSHHSAAALLGLCPPLDPREPVDVTVVGGSSIKRDGICAHRTVSIERRDVQTHKRLPVTSPARALLEIAGDVTEDQLEDALDTGLSSELVHPSDLRDVLARAGSGRKGAALLTALVDDRTGRASTSRSKYERILRRLIRAAELPQPEMNLPLHGLKVDCMWRELRLVVEVDGYRYHGSRAKFESDRRRDAILKAAGWVVVRVTPRQLDHEPFAVIARLAQAISWAQITTQAA